MKGGIAPDLILCLVLIGLGIVGIITVVTVLFPNIVIINQEVTCRNKIRSYCSIIVCGDTPAFDLKGCEKYIGSITPTKEECLSLGFKCGGQ